MPNNELQLLEWLASQPFATPNLRADVPIGDDMACIRPGADQILVSSDMLLSGTHFDESVHDWSDIGRKAVNCCLSDCAAMAAQPTALLVSLALPSSDMASVGQALMTHIRDAARVFDCSIIGGDSTAWLQPLAIDVVTIAVPWPGIAPVTRRGALPGDDLYVTGSLGGSILGKHLTFVPRIEEARQLAEALGSHLHAMIDLSDGLSLDLWRLCQASGCGAMIDLNKLEQAVSVAARSLSERDHVSAADHALHDGEDFELLLSVDPRARQIIERFDFELRHIGECTTTGMVIRDGYEQHELVPRGFVHGA